MSVNKDKGTRIEAITSMYSKGYNNETIADALGLELMYVNDVLKNEK